MDTASSLDWWSLAIQIVGYTGAGFAFLVGLRQYQRAQTYQKAEVLLKLIDSFEEDPKIDAACQMIDWDAREVQLSEAATFHFSNGMLVQALRVPKMDEGFTAEESYIRDCFDAFFDYFHKVHAFWKSDIVSFEDLRYFYYWFELLRSIGHYKEIPELQGALETYVAKYKFKGISELLAEYSKNPESLDLPNE